MAVDKLVDSTQLNSDLTSVANAIRTKGATSGQLVFPAGFVSAIGDISGDGGGNANVSQDANGYIVLDDAAPSGGGGSSLEEYLANTLTTYENSAIETIERSYFFACGDAMDSVSFPNLTQINALYGLGQCRAKSIYAPKLTFANRYGFADCPRLEKLALPSWAMRSTYNTDNIFNGCTALTHIDLGPNTERFGSNLTYRNCPLQIIVIRTPAAVAIMQNAACFNGTPFASGGAGGTIYIPKALYDHLGDGTALDYKAATNWSTIDGYGTITWAQIEGSIYETQYADGTPIT